MDFFVESFVEQSFLKSDTKVQHCLIISKHKLNKIIFYFFEN